MMRGLIILCVFTLFVICLTGSGVAQSPVADLKVSETYGTYANFGGLGQYSAGILNKGPDTATGVVISGGIGGGSITSVGSDHGTCVISGDSFTLDVGTLAPGEAVGIQMSGYPPNFGTHPNDITYCGGHFSVTGKPGNNAASVCIVVPGNSCPDPQGCGHTCTPGSFWCDRLQTCLPYGSVCPQ